ncbi:MAG: hypothetical protein FWH33_00740 [Oscillospiraceae bacterium]|nr:hypothetical protein [Oscillospiraceae bacterium]
MENLDDFEFNELDEEEELKARQEVGDHLREIFQERMPKVLIPDVKKFRLLKFVLSQVDALLNNGYEYTISVEQDPLTKKDINIHIVTDGVGASTQETFAIYQCIIRNIDGISQMARMDEKMAICLTINDVFITEQTQGT